MNIDGSYKIMSDSNKTLVQDSENKIIQNEDSEKLNKMNVRY